MKSYRVWMLDGFGLTVRAENEEEAERLAIEKTKEEIRGLAMTLAEKEQAITVDYVEERK